MYRQMHAWSLKIQKLVVKAALAGNMHVLGIGENINLPSAEYVIPDLTVFDQARSFWHLSEAVSRI